MASKLSHCQAQIPVFYVCTLCKEDKNVHWYCNDCQETLCERCKEFHKRGKKTRDDDVVPIKEVKLEIEQIVPEVCKHHPGKVCDLYCSDCQTEMCSMCFALHHRQHNWKHLEEEVIKKKKDAQRYVIALKLKLVHVKENIEKSHNANNSFNMKIDKACKKITLQKSKLKSEVDNVVDNILTELSARKQREDERYRINCQTLEKEVEEIQCSIKTTEQGMRNISGMALFEMEKTLQTTIPSHDSNTINTESSDNINFVPGIIDKLGLRTMIGHLTTACKYIKKDINSTCTTSLAIFKVRQQKEILSICPISDTHSWLSVNDFSGLLIVDKMGSVKESLALNFKPVCLALYGAADTLMTNFTSKSQILQMTQNRQVSVFANINPHKARDISSNGNKEVFVCSKDSNILVLNSSGDLIRILTTTGHTILCTSRNIIVGVGKNLPKGLVIKDISDRLLGTWTGELENGNQASKMCLRKMACDKYDRVFVPDCSNNQVYVLLNDGVRANCLLDKKHKVIRPTSVAVDPVGDVWIGCADGIVHVIRI